MTIFNFVKKNTILILLFSVLGVLSVLLPWIHYPRLELTIMGYDGDGYLISILFAFILFVNLYSISRKGGKNQKRYNILTFGLSFLILALSIYKIYAFYQDIFTFQTDNPITSYAGAGVYLEYGLYVIAALSFICLFFSSFGSLFSKNKHLLIFALVLIFAGGTSYLAFQKITGLDHLDKVEIEENLTSQFETMSKALVSKKSDQFVEFIHPIIYQSIGGKKKLAELMSELYKDVVIKETNFDKTLKTKTKGDAIQVLFLQSITFLKGMNEVSNTNKSYAFSYDGGKTWSFAGIEDKSFEDMKKLLPELFEEMRF